jgi:hypothetical protein
MSEIPCSYSVRLASRRFSFVVLIFSSFIIEEQRLFSHFDYVIMKSNRYGHKHSLVANEETKKNNFRFYWDREKALANFFFVL